VSPGKAVGPGRGAGRDQASAHGAGAWCCTGPVCQPALVGSEGVRPAGLW